MRAAKLTSALGASALLLGFVASTSAGQGRERAPIIRIYSRSGVDVVGTSTYVQPTVEVSENAYIFAVSMDLDGQIRVLHPDFPGLSVRMVAHKQLQLPNFFAGFSQSMPGDRVYSSVAYSGYNRYGVTDSRGTVIALASRAPFNLDLVESGGDWDIIAIRRLIENRSPQEGAQMLATYLGAKGEPIGRDFMRFAGQRSDYYAYNNYYSYSPCDVYGGYEFAPGCGFNPLAGYGRINRLGQTGQSTRILGYDICGFPIIAFAPSQTGKVPVARATFPRGDTTVFPKARFPHGVMPRHPAGSASNDAPEGIFPLPQRAELPQRATLPQRAGLPQMGDVTITAPTRRRGEPVNVFQDYRPQSGTLSAPQGRLPIDRAIPARGEPATSGATGVQPVREYRHEPRVESPPPSRVPERPREVPAPVVHERPSTLPPPPPRVEAPTTKAEPAHVPPPKQQ